MQQKSVCIFMEAMSGFSRQGRVWPSTKTGVSTVWPPAAALQMAAVCGAGGACNAGYRALRSHESPSTRKCTITIT